ncbi:MAG TPA: ThuA domain-containing protein [Aliidongia sp.]|uniref:ThuA domain-containing protein n=1 Tax=Aliidongia sp. TaxID=1914230 RepID=UPI002DDD0B55|nr:ThuA domain-containing protein [Aliidongia sp.]HEV2677371.1 ThuA domain-containing protein [Aliidongia sp.]
MRNLILTGGIGHPFADASAALADILAADGIVSTVTEDIEQGLAGLDGFDLVTVYALRWRMLIGEKYAPHREQWAFSLSDAGRQALTRFVEAGGGLLALHTAVICFDDWPGWHRLLGAEWIWGRSAHPPFGPVAVDPTGKAHAVAEGVVSFELRDEVYGNLDMDEDVEPLLTADAGAGSWPVAWTRRAGQGRVVVDLLGHDRASLEQPMHRRLLRQGARWAAEAL